MRAHVQRTTLFALGTCFTRGACRSMSQVLLSSVFLVHLVDTRVVFATLVSIAPSSTTLRILRIQRGGSTRLLHSLTRTDLSDASRAATLLIPLSVVTPSPLIRAVLSSLGDSALRNATITLLWQISWPPHAHSQTLSPSLLLLPKPPRSSRQVLSWLPPEWRTSVRWCARCIGAT